MSAFNVARPRQRNIYQTRHQQHVICIQTRKRTSFEQLFHLDYFTRSFELLIHLDYFTWRRVGWWQNSLVARWPDTVTQGNETINIRIRYTSTSPLPENRKDENRKIWKLKDVKIVAAEISLINSVPARVLTLSKMCPSPDVWKS